MPCRHAHPGCAHPLFPYPSSVRAAGAGTLPGVIDLLAATAGTPLLDRPHWPALPPVVMDEENVLHAGAGCAHAFGPTRALGLDPTPEASSGCDCLDPALDALVGHPAAGELLAADQLLGDLEALPMAHRALASWLALTPQQLAADPHGAVARLPLPPNAHGSHQVHVALWDLGQGVLRARSAQAGLGLLPEPLRTAVADRLAADLPVLEAALAAWRSAVSVPLLNAQAGPSLARPVPPQAQGWLFATDAEDDPASCAAWLALVWPGPVHLSADGTRFAARLPAAVALGWAGRGVDEVLVDDPGALQFPARGFPYQPRPRLAAPGELALDADQVRLALQLWEPPVRRGQGLEVPAMHALAAVRAAAAVLRPPRVGAGA